MIKSKLLSLFTVTLLCLPAMASTNYYPWLTLQMADGSEISVSSSGLNISYSDGTLHLQSSTVDQSFPTASLKSICFSESPAGIEIIIADTDGSITFYTLDGVKVGCFDTIDSAKDILPTGIYIAKGESKVIKIIF